METNKKCRVESDLLGELQVPAEAYYGVQTQRAINNYKISTTKMNDYPDFIIAMAYVKKAAAMANGELGVLNKTIADAIMNCLLYTSPSPRDRQKSRMPSSA